MWCEVDHHITDQQRTLTVAYRSRDGLGGVVDVDVLLGSVRGSATRVRR
jgi:hypothetical protein